LTLSINANWLIKKRLVLVWNKTKT
jgi:hypothetical protein